MEARVWLMAGVESPLIEELLKLDVLVVRDTMIKLWKQEFQLTMIRIRNQTVKWAVENLVKDTALVSVMSFSLPLTGILIRDFRIFYIQAYQLGAGVANRLPVAGLRLRADAATMVFIIRIERDLKDEWRRLNTSNKSVIRRATHEVFQNVIH